MKNYFLIVLHLLTLLHGLTAEDKTKSSIKNISTKLNDLVKEAAEAREKYMKEFGRPNAALNHLVESVYQAEHSAIHAFEKLKEDPIPNVGNVTKGHVFREYRGYFFQMVGLYGVTMVIGMILYYAISSLFVSGNIFIMFISSLPMLFSSIALFPAAFLTIEMLFGLSYFTGLLSYYGFEIAFESFDFLLSKPDLVESIGKIMLLMGVFSLFFREVIYK